MRKDQARRKKTADDQRSPAVSTSPGRAPLLERPSWLTGTSWLRPGSPVAPRRNRLVLLPFGPDTIHRLPPHRTQPSTLLSPAVPERTKALKEEFNPAYSGFRVQGTASAPSSTTEAILPDSIRFVKEHNSLHRGHTAKAVLAEREGFEPSRVLALRVFETRALSRTMRPLPE